MAEPEQDATTRQWRRLFRAEVVYLAQLFALTGLAIAQPVLDVFGRSPAEFLFRRVEAVDIVQFAVLIVVVPPLLAWAVAAPLALIGPRVRRVAHLVEVGALTALLTVVALNDLASPGTIALLLLAAGVAAGFVALYVRFRGIRVWLALLGLAPVVFLGLFVFNSQVTDLILDSGGGGEAGVVGSDDPPSVVYVVLDELPLASLIDTEGNIDAELFPNLAALAAEGAWFNNVSTVAGATWYATPPLLTGNMPIEHAQPTATDYPENLFVALSEDYRLEAHEAISRMCPPTRCEETGVAAGGLRTLLGDARAVFETMVSLDETAVAPTATLTEIYDEVLEPRWDVFEGNQPARYTEFLEGLGAEDPTLSFLQILVPHERWETLPSGIRYPVPELDAGRLIHDWTDDPAPVEVARQRHLLKTVYADRLVGGIVERLKDAGAYDETIIVVTSDHGVAFRPGEPVRATAVDSDPERILPELLWVPLLIKAPEFEPGTVRDDNVLTVDIAPTIAELVGLEEMWDAEGRSLVGGPVRDDETKPFYKIEISEFGNFLDPLRLVPTARYDEVLALSVGATVPPGDADERLYQMLPYGSLVGREVSGLDRGPPGDLTLVLDDSEAFEQVDPASGSLPVLVDGHLDVDRSLGGRVALVVNGRVAFVSAIFEWDGSPAAITGIVPDFLLEQGRNEVEAYVVLGDEQEPLLIPIDVAD